MAKILLVEDDYSISQTIKDWLQDEMYVVESTENGKDGLYLLLNFEYDLAILDWQLPDLSGPEIAKGAIAKGRQVPILMLTSKNSTSDKIEGLDAGAYDYVTKPCSLEEISARVRALLRRSSAPSTASVIKVGELTIDIPSHEVFISEQKVKLSPSEFEILKLMAKSAGSSFSTDAIFARLWSDKPNVSKQLVKVHVMNLRKKLAGAGSAVELLTNDLNEYYLKV
ncbi:MAG: response regulator transcription factor [Candidatus Obscuribacterales bacterium]|nr:response regulator transcription factor [Candidatus Obscuribacterales bacterium]